jgi:hypothetical protein
MMMMTMMMTTMTMMMMTFPRQPYLVMDDNRQVQSASAYSRDLSYAFHVPPPPQDMDKELLARHPDWKQRLDKFCSLDVDSAIQENYFLTDARTIIK